MKSVECYTTGSGDYVKIQSELLYDPCTEDCENIWVVAIEPSSFSTSLTLSELKQLVKILEEKEK